MEMEEWEDLSGLSARGLVEMDILLSGDPWNFRSETTLCFGIYRHECRAARNQPQDGSQDEDERSSVTSSLLQVFETL